YTVREIIPRDPPDYGEEALRFVEVANFLDEYELPSGKIVWSEVNFRASRFFPVQTANIDGFLAMLARARNAWAEDVEAEAWTEALGRIINEEKMRHGQ